MYNTASVPRCMHPLSCECHSNQGAPRRDNHHPRGTITTWRRHAMLGTIPGTWNSMPMWRMPDRDHAVTPRPEPSTIIISKAKNLIQSIKRKKFEASSRFNSPISLSDSFEHDDHSATSNWSSDRSESFTREMVWHDWPEAGYRETRRFARHEPPITSVVSIWTLLIRGLPVSSIDTMPNS